MRYHSGSREDRTCTNKDLWSLIVSRLRQEDVWNLALTILRLGLQPEQSMMTQVEGLGSRQLLLGNAMAFCKVPETDTVVLSQMSDSASVSPSARDCHGTTPLLRVSAHRPEAVYKLIEAGANPRVASAATGDTALHQAATRGNLSLFAMLASMKGVDPHAENYTGNSAIHATMHFAQFASLTLNGDFAIEDTAPARWSHWFGYQSSFGFGAQITWLHRFKLYKRRIRNEKDLRRILNLRPEVGWTPLCMFAMHGDLRSLEALLDAGADINYEGSPDGSALMVACSVGTLASVKLLIRRGAPECYLGPGGVVRSALASARSFNAVVTWLLVERYTEQPKLEQMAANEDTVDDPQPSTAVLGSRTLGRLSRAAPRPNTAVRKAEYVIMGMDERGPGESSFDYYRRLVYLKKSLRGQVIRADDLRKTCRPSRLVPTERVRRHPDDNRSPRDG